MSVGLFIKLRIHFLHYALKCEFKKYVGMLFRFRVPDTTGDLGITIQGQVATAADVERYARLLSNSMVCWVVLPYTAPPQRTYAARGCCNRNRHRG